MSIKDELGNRMKTNYEQIPKLRLTRRTPVIIRIDGKAFHSYTRGFQKQFDLILMGSMQETMKYAHIIVVIKLLMVIVEQLDVLI